MIFFVSRSNPCRVDIQLALYLGSKPLFYADEISWDPFFTIAKTGPKISQASTVDALVRELLGSTEDRLGVIWSDAREFCALVNLAHLTGRRIEPRLFQETMVSLQYRLLHKETPDAGLRNTRNEALRLGMLAFTTTIFLHVAGIETRYFNLAQKMERIIKDLDMTANTQESEFRLWLLFVAILSLPSKAVEHWLDNTLSQTIETLAIKSWQKTKLVLKQFLWIDVLHDMEGERIFSSRNR